jgi:hypothetical protein
MHVCTCLIQQALIKDGQCIGLKIGFVFHMQLWFFWKNDFPFAWVRRPWLQSFEMYIWESWSLCVWNFVGFNQQHTKTTSGRTYPYYVTWKEIKTLKFNKEESLIWCCDLNLCPCFQISLCICKNQIIVSNIHHNFLLIISTSLLPIVEDTKNAYKTTRLKSFPLQCSS